MRVFDALFPICLAESPNGPLLSQHGQYAGRLRAATRRPVPPFRAGRLSEIPRAADKSPTTECVVPLRACAARGMLEQWKMDYGDFEGA
jgi:hypothetical protein